MALRPLIPLGLMLLLTACSDAPAPAAPTPAVAPPTPSTAAPPQFAGLPVPGRAGDARTAGYTDCRKDWAGSQEVFACRPKSTVDLFGVTLDDPHVVFDGEDHLATSAETRAAAVDIKTADPLSLSYGGLAFSVPAAVYDEACVMRAHRGKEGWETAIPPAECAKPGGVETFHDGLKKEGWILVSDRRYEEFQKRGVNIVITIHRALGDRHPASIGVREAAAVAEAFARFDERQAAERAAESAESAFGDAMRSDGKRQ